LFEY
jgi:cation-transporting ATPase F